MAEPLLRFLVLLPPGVGLPGVYPGGVLPGTGENKDRLGNVAQLKQRLLSMGSILSIP